MGNQWNFNDPDDDDDNDNQGGNSNQGELPKAARAHMRKLETELKATLKQLADIQAQQRQVSVSDVVKAKGFDPKVADFVPTDVNGEDAVGKWLDERSSLFMKATTSNTPAAETPPEEVLPQDVMDAMAALGNITSNATSPARPADLMAKLSDPKLTRDELDSIMRAGGAKF